MGGITSEPLAAPQDTAWENTSCALTITTAPLQKAFLESGTRQYAVGMSYKLTKRQKVNGKQIIIYCRSTGLWGFLFLPVMIYSCGVLSASVEIQSIGQNFEGECVSVCAMYIVWKLA